MTGVMGVHTWDIDEDIGHCIFCGTPYEPDNEATTQSTHYSEDDSLSPRYDE